MRGKPGLWFAFLSDPLRDRHAELGHAVDHRTSYLGFDLLRFELSSAQRGADQGLVAEHRCFDKRTFSIAYRPLPAATTLLLDHLNVTVAWARCGAGGGTEHCRRPRGNDHRRRRVRLTGGHRPIDWLSVI